MKTTAELVNEIKPGREGLRQTFGNVSTWFERSGDGKTVRLIRETVTKRSTVSDVVKTWRS